MDSTVTCHSVSFRQGSTLMRRVFLISSEKIVITQLCFVHIGLIRVSNGLRKCIIICIV